MFKRFTLLSILGLIYVYIGISNVSIDADLARDLSFISDILIKKVVWLGPQLSVGFPISPLYYYFFIPLLVLTSGNPYSLLLTPVLASLASLLICLYVSKINKFLSHILVGTVSLSHMWLLISSTIWNGYLYLPFLFASISILWFKKNLFFSLLLYGISCAIHPAALLIAPLYMYEWFKQEDKIKNLLIGAALLLLPWSPILVFESITRGFLIRQFLAQSSSLSTVVFQIDSKNLVVLANTFSLPLSIFIILFVILVAIATGRARKWLLLIGIPLVFLVLCPQLHTYYLYPISITLLFIWIIVLSKYLLGKIVLVSILIFEVFFVSLYLCKLSTSSEQRRSFELIEQLVSTSMQQLEVPKDQRVAVIHIRDEQNSTPQGDEFRFFLRLQGYTAVNIPEYPQAEYLLYFIEIEPFDWHSFSDWHTEYFGKKVYVNQMKIDTIKVVLFKRQAD